jgi:hypothetical protein
LFFVFASFVPFCGYRISVAAPRLIVFVFEALKVMRAAAGAQCAEGAEDDAQQDEAPSHGFAAPR